MLQILVFLFMGIQVKKSNINSTSQTRNLIKKWKEDLNKHFSTETIQRPQKRCSVSLITIIMCAQSLSRVWLFVTSWSEASGSSVGFPRQEYWNGLPFPIPGDLLDPGIEPVFPWLPGGFFTTAPLRKLSSITRDIQTMTTMRYHPTSVRMDII